LSTGASLARCEYACRSIGFQDTDDDPDRTIFVDTGLYQGLDSVE
jgi:hypothetical protein